MKLLLLISIVLVVTACATSYLEMNGECVVRRWSFYNITMRKDLVCDLPAPEEDEVQVRDRKMNTILEEAQKVLKK